jgi:uncharacterized protein (TIGR03790 family)
MGCAKKAPSLKAGVKCPQETRIDIAGKKLQNGGMVKIGLSATCLLLALAALLPAADRRPLQPAEIVVVANGSVGDSVPLARYYMKRRGIPEKNLLVLSLSDKEYCRRDEYERQVAASVRAFLDQGRSRENHFRCILTMYGVPLVVSDPGLSPGEKARLRELQGELGELRSRRSGAPQAKKIAGLEREIMLLKNSDKAAALDSELALVREKTYPLAFWLANPLFAEYDGRPENAVSTEAFLVSRLDGPSAPIVRRMIDDSLAAEASGLRGKAYFDARWPDPGKKELIGYAHYDASIHRAAEIVKKSGKMAVIEDDRELLFQPGDAPVAALYCGWYSLASYVDAFAWVPGAVGYHIASAECVTLKKPGSRAWCKTMLEKGAAATVGPVGEPYVHAFPPPELFFRLLLDGRLTLAECFALSNPYLSWKMVLIGDPLYRPFMRESSLQ